MGKVKFIPNHQKVECWHCEGSGQHKDNEKCRICDGTGKFTRKHYYLIADMPDGQKIAFGVDTIK